MKDFEEAKRAARSLGSHHEVARILYEIETLQIREKYFQELKRRPGDSHDIRMELAWEYGRSEGSIRAAIYEFNSSS